MLILALVAIVLLGIVIIFWSASPVPSKDSIMEKDDSEEMERIDEMEDKKMNEKGEVMSDTGSMMTYQGAVLAGTKAKVLDFTKADYDAALNANKHIVLYFYANWCPICKKEIPEFYAAFASLDSDTVVAFRVNFKDDETDNDEEALAREFGVPYQHTKVFIKNGAQLYKAPDSWDKARYISEITNRLLK